MPARVRSRSLSTAQLSDNANALATRRVSVAPSQQRDLGLWGNAPLPQGVRLARYGKLHLFQSADLALGLCNAYWKDYRVDLGRTDCEKLGLRFADGWFVEPAASSRDEARQSGDLAIFANSPDREKGEVVNAELKFVHRRIAGSEKPELLLDLFLLADAPFTGTDRRSARFKILCSYGRKYDRSLRGLNTTLSAQRNAAQAALPARGSICKNCLKPIPAAENFIHRFGPQRCVPQPPKPLSSWCSWLSLFCCRRGH
jgi:hypothetical protein